jgi:hypothetical protein
LSKGAEYLDHILKVNSFAGKWDLTKISWVRRYFQGFGELLHDIADRDEVDFGGVKLRKQEAIS